MDHIIQATVPPTNSFLIFLTVVLGVHDQEVRAPQKIGQSLFLLSGENLGGIRCCTGWRMPMTGMRFIVRKKYNRTTGCEQTITYANARMVCKPGLDPKVANAE